MAEESTDNDSKPVINLMNDELFELKCLIKASGINQSAYCEIGRRQLLAFSTHHTDIGLFYQSDVNKQPVVKRIPWYRAPNRGIAALCFDPTGSWLLTATVDGSLYIIPVVALLDDRQTIDHKWSVNDATQLSIADHQSSYSKPSALTWWQGVTQCSHIGIVGTEEGEIIFINLENGQWIDSARVNGSIASLYICQDNNLEIVSLLVTSKTHQQWRMILEQRTNCIFPLNTRTGSSFHSRYEEESKTPPRSRLQGLKQLSVEKLAIIRQKLAESRNKNATNLRRDSESSSGTDELEASPKLLPRNRDTLILEPLLEDIYLSPQYTRQGQHLYTAYCAGSNHITIHGTDISVVPYHMYKMPDLCTDILLTQRLFFVTGPHRRSLWIVSCSLSETKIGDEGDYNQEATVARFKFEDSKELITCIYRSTDYKDTDSGSSAGSSSDSKEDKSCLPSKIDDLNIEVPLVDTCIIVTNYGVYKVILRKPLLNVFIDLALKKRKSDIEKAARLGIVFGLNVSQLFEAAGDIHLTNSRFSEAAALYKLSRCRLLKGVLKTAATGHTQKLLGCLTHCLTPPAVSELTTTTRIHLSNLAVFAFSELILRATHQESKSLYKEFLTFLSKNTFYDERWVVDVVGQTSLWKVLHHLATQRGLYAQVCEVLMKTVQPYNPVSMSNTPLNTKYGLLICISEPSLLQSMLATPSLAKSHMMFVLSNLAEFQAFVLQRLVTLYDPTNPAFRPLLIRYRARRRTTSHGSQSSQCDSLDSSDMLEEAGSLVEEILETFILTLLTLINKRSTTLKHNPALVARTTLPGIEKRFTDFTQHIDFKRRLLAAGYGHVALIRNGSVYTWGSSAQGCLGTGPTISRYGPPQAVTVFKNLEMEVLSVSCGRCHTLAVTNNGVYAWGGSQFGQLGLGRLLQTPSPEMIVSLAEEIIVDAVTGQYHSVALTMDGRVFTWGWGVHGQLGHGNTLQKNIPTVVSSLLGIIIRGIAAGHAHTLALSAEGQVYAFGCNIFGQLGTGNNIKSSLPVVINLLPEPMTDIASGYFHNLAVSATNKLYTWGSSPQVLRLQTQAQKKTKMMEFQAAAEKYAESLEDFEAIDDQSNDKLSSIEKLAIKTVNERKLNCPNVPKTISLRDINLGLLEEAQTHLKPVLVDTSLVNGRIIQISTGCHHSSLLTKDGTVYTWGRNLDGQIGNGTRKDVLIPTPLLYNPVSVLAHVPPRNSSENNSQENNKRVIKAVRVCCGCEFTIAIQPGGTVLAWGSYNSAQLGRPPNKDSNSGNAEKLVLIKSSKRLVRLPHGAHVVQDTPSQVPNIPTPIITYQSYDVTPLAGRVRPLSLVEKSYGELTLHYVLEQFNGLYDAAKIMDKCDELGNYQARSKLALLEQNYSIALAYQLKTVNPEYYARNETQANELNQLRPFAVDESPETVKKVKENTELFDKQVEKNLVETIEESEEKKRMKMSISRSLDSISIVEELHTFDCQGGSEELCEDTKSEDISLDLTEDALDDNEALSHRDDKNINLNLPNNNHIESADLLNKELANQDKDIKICNSVLDASNVIKFYINEIDESAQKIMRQVLLTIFDFWIKNQLPMGSLEKILLEHINKLYYSLGLLVFCQNQLSDDDTNKNDSSQIINYVSTNFCLQVCQMLLHHIDTGKPALEYVELLSLLTAKNYGPVGYAGKESKSPEQMMEGIISAISTKSTDPRPFIHIKDPEKVSRFLESEEDTIVFTCGHHFPMSIYQSEVIPSMEAELLMTQPLSLPCTAQSLGNMLSRVCKMEIMCPRCVPRAIQNAVKNLMDR
ncbi:uncharacterized protein LOC130673595 [Microplitis mediator]|uniref:uncharacterized protein LOC130673595 n=1 Tax=Microplitis mediator TaxID=375433 RepID=UPI002557770E|nr:uncharacterized protein LOC130673595 [Microplitis mediator]XP_057334648.1 uncharacterized protein LOC130673595 [Microplitis mediator]